MSVSRSAILLCPLINPFAGELAGRPRSTVLSCHPCHVAGHVFVITRVTGDAPQAPVRQGSHGSLQYSPPGKPRHGGPCDWPRPVSRAGSGPGPASFPGSRIRAELCSAPLAPRRRPQQALGDGGRVHPLSSPARNRGSGACVALPLSHVHRGVESGPKLVVWAQNPNPEGFRATGKQLGAAHSLSLSLHGSAQGLSPSMARMRLDGVLRCPEKPARKQGRDQCH